MVPEGKTYADFQRVVAESIKSFGDNKLLELMSEHKFEIAHYHCYLLTIFHQTFYGPSTFALAGANCDARQHVIRDYLIKHAEEERSHWEWVIDDLESTGYDGADPRTSFPTVACQAYVAFNMFLAIQHPISRLGAAAVLEGIGATYGKRTAETMIRDLKLRPNQLKFIFGHGDTDVGHSAEIGELLNSSNLSEYDWAYLCHAATTGGALYKAMYDEAGKMQLKIKG